MTASEAVAPTTSAQPTPAPVSEFRDKRQLSNDFFADFTDPDAGGAEQTTGQLRSQPSPAEEELAELNGEPPDAGEELEEAPEEDATDDGLPAGKGTRDNPLTIKDLPEDRFVKVKVDGEEQTVDLRDAVNGYIRRQTFDKGISKANAAVQEATAMATKAVEERTMLRQNFDGFISDAERMFPFYLDNHPETLEAMAIKYAQLRQAENQDPRLKMQREFAAKQRKLEEETARTRKEREEWESQRTRTQQAEAARKAFEPAYQEGLRAAGFPKVTKELQDEIRVRLDYARRRDGKLSPDTVKGAVIAAAKFLGAPAVPAAAKPAPVAKPTAKPAKPTNGRKDWASVPRPQRMNDPNFWFSK